MMPYRQDGRRIANCEPGGAELRLVIFEQEAWKTGKEMGGIWEHADDTRNDGRQSERLD